EARWSCAEARAGYTKDDRRGGGAPQYDAAGLWQREPQREGNSSNLGDGNEERIPHAGRGGRGERGRHLAGAVGARARGGEAKVRQLLRAPQCPTSRGQPRPCGRMAVFLSLTELPVTSYAKTATWKSPWTDLISCPDGRAGMRRSHESWM
ncbi:hypothetical protein BN1723_016240, partial [Verticillium longisporum]